MRRIPRRDRRGQGLIGLLLVVIIIGYLWVGGGKNALQLPAAATPASHSVKSLPKPVQNLPTMAGNSTFKMTAEEIKKAVAEFQLMKGGLPRDLAELHRETGIDLKMDPWGGQYYVHQGWLRCTGNKQLTEKVW
ncbi:MAG: hypothetical protein FD129_3307 [bacterium]|nr:MAG: hypothetical protein FD129_3307 [bacterium]